MCRLLRPTLFSSFTSCAILQVVAELQERSSSPDDSSSVVSMTDALQEVSTMQLVAIATACLTCDKAKQHVSVGHAACVISGRHLWCCAVLLICVVHLTWRLVHTHDVL
jgi:hypothetical protein